MTPEAPCPDCNANFIVNDTLYEKTTKRIKSSFNGFGFCGDSDCGEKIYFEIGGGTIRDIRLFENMNPRYLPDSFDYVPREKLIKKEPEEMVMTSPYDGLKGAKPLTKAYIQTLNQEQVVPSKIVTDLSSYIFPGMTKSYVESTNIKNVKELLGIKDITDEPVNNPLYEIIKDDLSTRIKLFAHEIFDKAFDSIEGGDYTGLFMGVAYARTELTDKIEANPGVLELSNKIVSGYLSTGNIASFLDKSVDGRSFCEYNPEENVYFIETNDDQQIPFNELNYDVVLTEFVSILEQKNDDIEATYFANLDDLIKKGIFHGNEFNSATFMSNIALKKFKEDGFKVSTDGNYSKDGTEEIKISSYELINLIWESVEKDIKKLGKFDNVTEAITSHASFLTVFYDRYLNHLTGDKGNVHNLSTQAIMYGYELAEVYQKIEGFIDFFTDFLENISFQPLLDPDLDMVNYLTENMNNSFEKVKDVFEPAEIEYLGQQLLDKFENVMRAGIAQFIGPRDIAKHAKQDFETQVIAYKMGLEEAAKQRTDINSEVTDMGITNVIVDHYEITKPTEITAIKTTEEIVKQGAATITPKIIKIEESLGKSDVTKENIKEKLKKMVWKVL